MESLTFPSELWTLKSRLGKLIIFCWYGRITAHRGLALNFGTCLLLCIWNVTAWEWWMSISMGIVFISTSFNYADTPNGLRHFSRCTHVAEKCIASSQIHICIDTPSAAEFIADFIIEKLGIKTDKNLSHRLFLVVLSRWIFHRLNGLPFYYSSTAGNFKYALNRKDAIFHVAIFFASKTKLKRRICSVIQQYRISSCVFSRKFIILHHINLSCYRSIDSSSSFMNLNTEQW